MPKTDKDRMEEYHALGDIFYGKSKIYMTMWELGSPTWTERIPRAAIAFNNDGSYLEFLFNPKFWDHIKPYERAFVCAHEFEHFILGHGLRIREYMDDINKSIEDKIKNKQLMEISQIALDLEINQLLFNRFGFDRSLLTTKVENDTSLKYNLVMPDTVFPELLGKGWQKKVKLNSYYEYYFNILRDIAEEQGKLNPKVVLLDDHSMMAGLPDNGDGDGESNGNKVPDPYEIDKDSYQDLTDDMLDNIDYRASQNMTEEEQKELQEKHSGASDDSGDGTPKGVTPKVGGLQAGTVAGRLKKRLSIKKPIKKKKWETIIKNWSLKYLGERYDTSWTRKNRRFETMYIPGMFLPTDIELDLSEKSKIIVDFYLDTSGSCAGYAERFFTAANSLPDDKFEVRLFCFDTKVYATTLKSGKLYGFGGTAFDIIERDIQNRISSKKIHAYPQAVFIITDGYGNRVNVPQQYQDRWHWFMTEHHSKTYIPKGCKVYELKDFE